MAPRRRTPETLTAQAIHAAQVALDAVGVEEVSVRDGQILARFDGREVWLGVVPVAYCTGERARELTRQRTSSANGPIRLVVADRMTAEARAVLTQARWSWLDRRGRLSVRAPGVRIDVEVPADPGIVASGEVSDPIAGRGGLTVAYWLCDHPGASLSPTKDAARLRLAPSTISTAVNRFRDAGLVDEAGVGIFPELFWELADVWRVERTWLLASPDPTLHRSPDSGAPGWRRTGTAAAAAYGAPVVAMPGLPVELYVPGPLDISIAVRRYGSAQPGLGAAVVAVAPISAVTAGLAGTPTVDGWPAAPTLATALDLAQDRARGREILEGWEADDAVWR